MFNIKIKAETESFVTEEFGTFGWPIKYFDKAQNHNEEYNYISINLRIDDNTKPILFIENTDLLIENNASRFLDDKKLINGTSTDWSKEITLKFPTIVSESVKENIPYCLKINYLRQEHNELSPDSVIKNEFYFNNAFASIDLPNLADNDYTFQKVHNPNLNYISGKLTDITNDFSYVGENGAQWDNNRIVFYNKAFFKKKSTGKFFDSSTNTYSNLGFNLEGDFNKMSFLSNDIQINKNTIQEVVSSGVYQTINIIDIIKNNGFPNTYEDLLCLGITQAEFTTLKNLTGFTNKHNRYIYIQEITGSPFEDKDEKRFRKFELKVQGLNSEGNRLIVAPAPPIYVYTQNGLVFTTKEFTLGFEAEVRKNYLESFMKILDSNSLPTINFFDGLINYTLEEFKNLSNSNFWQNYNNLDINNPIGLNNKSLFELDKSIKSIIIDFKQKLDKININKQEIESLVKIKGAELLNYAKKSIRNNSVTRNKDGILYLSRLIMQIILKNHPKILSHFYTDIDYFSKIFEFNSRGLKGTEKPDFSAYPHFKILISGFDPFGNAFPASYFDWEGHQSNPSGNLALSLDNVELIAENGNKAIIKSVILPVRFKEFDDGWIENFFTSYINDNSIKMIITFSYGVDGSLYNFEIERFASRYRGIGSPDNNEKDSEISIYLNQSDKDNYEFIETTLPINDLYISNDVGLDQKAEFEYSKNNFKGDNKKIVNPQGDNDLNPKYYNQIKFPNLENYPNPNADKIIALNGSGGDYLSNEVFYRVSFLRKTLKPNKLTGHIHVGFLVGNNKTNRDEMLSIIKEALKQAIKKF